LSYGPWSSAPYELQTFKFLLIRHRITLNIAILISRTLWFPLSHLLNHASYALLFIRWASSLCSIHSVPNNSSTFWFLNLYVSSPTISNKLSSRTLVALVRCSKIFLFSFMCYIFVMSMKKLSITYSNVHRCPVHTLSSISARSMSTCPISMSRRRDVFLFPSTHLFLLVVLLCSARSSLISMLKVIIIFICSF